MKQKPRLAWLLLFMGLISLVLALIAISYGKIATGTATLVIATSLLIASVIESTNIFPQ